MPSSHLLKSLSLRGSLSYLIYTGRWIQVLEAFWVPNSVHFTSLSLCLSSCSLSFFSPSQELDLQISKFRCQRPHRRFPSGKASRALRSLRVRKKRERERERSRERQREGVRRERRRRRRDRTLSRISFSAPYLSLSLSLSFSDNPAVIFDLFNEPFPDANTADSDNGWTCWRDGGRCPGSA
jgi:hypothetical protein